jgi:hypothetical protein
MSKLHKNSKRKDLAFVTFSTHEEAKNSVEYFKSQYGNEGLSTPSVIQENQNEVYRPPVLHNPLGENVNVSLAFSQQAMQAKKKVKETRKKPSSPLELSIPSSMHSNMHIPQIPNIPIPTNTNFNLAPSTTTSPSVATNPNLNATAMLAMMNIINMNKVSQYFLSFFRTI